jgi:nucleoside 2-deoxyribosyltransferase
LTGWSTCLDSCRNTNTLTGTRHCRKRLQWGVAVDSLPFEPPVLSPATFAARTQESPERMHTIQPFRHPQRVYCAGPLFNEAERREMLRLAYVLQRAGFEPFLPHADGMEFSAVRPWLLAQGNEPGQVGQWLHEAVFALDVYQVVLGCGSLVFNMNGRVPDEGGVAESAIAWTLGKPIVLYKEDVRSAIVGRDNPLIVGQTGFRTVNDLEAIGSALRERIADFSPDPEASVPCPPHLARTLEAGERLWNELTALGRERPDDAVGRLVLDLFAAPASVATV